MRFSYRMVPEVYQVFWAAMARGEFITDAAARLARIASRAPDGCSRPVGCGRGAAADLKGRCLTLTQREEIGLGRARGESIRTIAAAIGRAPSTVSRELRRNTDGQGRYRATTAHALAYGRASRPKPAKLVTNLRLRGKVEDDLAKKYSPEQIAGRLKVEFPDQPELQVSTETIYQSLYVQSRGALKHELTRCLRTGRAVRRPSPESRSTQEPDPEHDQHRRTAGRGRRPGRARPLGISMMLSSRLSECGWRWCRVRLSRSRAQGRRAAAGEGDHGLAVGAAVVAFLQVVVAVRSGAHHAGLRGEVENVRRGRL